MRLAVCPGYRNPNRVCGIETCGEELQWVGDEREQKTREESDDGQTLKLNILKTVLQITKEMVVVGL